MVKIWSNVGSLLIKGDPAGELFRFIATLFILSCIPANHAQKYKGLILLRVRFPLPGDKENHGLSFSTRSDTALL